MKRILTISFIAVLTIFNSCCSSTVTPEKTDELKVLTWNIWHGGHQKLIPTHSCEGTLGILKHSGADVILMVETYGSSASVADELGYYHRLFSPNLSVYSKYPITETYTFTDSISTSNFGGVEIDMNGTRVRLFDTWLSHLTDSIRMGQVKKILSALKPFIAESNEIPIIMGGDFNGNSHLDWTEATKDMYNHNGVVITEGVSKEMEVAGFEDSFRKIHADPAKNMGTTWMHPRMENWEHVFSTAERTGKPHVYKPEELRHLRIDYIYYQGDNLKVTESETYYKNLGEMLPINGKEFFYASDHGLVLTTFKLKK